MPFLDLPTYAAREARALLERFTSRLPDHVEEWESMAVYIRGQLRDKVLGGFPKPPRPVGRFRKSSIVDRLPTTALQLQLEPRLSMPVLLQTKPGIEGRQAVCVLLHLDGKTQALKHPLAKTLIDRKWFVVAPELRATGDLKPAGDAIHEAADHNSAEHALWVGRPLLGQWVFDVACLFDWLAIQPGLDQRRLVVAGLGPAGVVALCAAGLLENRISTAAAIGTPVTYVTDQAYGSFMRMGLLAPGVLRLGDIPQLAALSAPRRLVITEGRTPQGKLVRFKELQEAYAFPHLIYRLYKAEYRFFLKEEVRTDDVVDAFG